MWWYNRPVVPLGAPTLTCRCSYSEYIREEVLPTNHLFALLINFTRNISIRGWMLIYRKCVHEELLGDTPELKYYHLAGFQR